MHLLQDTTSYLPTKHLWQANGVSLTFVDGHWHSSWSVFVNMFFSIPRTNFARKKQTKDNIMKQQSQLMNMHEQQHHHKSWICMRSSIHGSTTQSANADHTQTETQKQWVESVGGASCQSLTAWRQTGWEEKFFRLLFLSFLASRRRHTIKHFARNDTWCCNTQHQHPVSQLQPTVVALQTLQQHCLVWIYLHM